MYIAVVYLNYYVRCGYWSGRKSLIWVVPTALTLTLDHASVTLPNRRRPD